MYRDISSFHLFHFKGRSSASKFNGSGARNCPILAVLAVLAVLAAGPWGGVSCPDGGVSFDIFHKDLPDLLDSVLQWVTYLLTPCLKGRFKGNFNMSSFTCNLIACVCTRAMTHAL